jgi:hypothetical protein
MTVYNFKITLDIKEPIPQHPFEQWYPLLASIYGTPSKSFDGYVSSLEYLDNLISIHCYLVEDTDNQGKLSILKERYSDWTGYQKISMIDAVKQHARILGYTISTIGITIL